MGQDLPAIKPDYQSFLFATARSENGAWWISALLIGWCLPAKCTGASTSWVLELDNWKKGQH